MYLFDSTDVDLTGKVRSVGQIHVAADSGTDAAINFRNGGATGDIIIPLRVPAGTSAHISLFRPVLFPKGLYVEVDSAAETGTVVPG